MKKGEFHKKRWIFIGAVLLLLAGAAVFAVEFSRVTVEAETLKKGEVLQVVEESGVVTARNTVMVTAKNGGEVKEVLVEEGDRVAGGTLLARSDITSAELDIKSLRAQLSGLRTQYSQAKSVADKNKALYEQGALSLEAYKASSAAANLLSSQISALSYTIKSSEEAKGLKGITAPLAGTITEVFVKKGELVQPGGALFEITDLNQLYVKAELVTEDADLLTEGDPARVYNEDTGFSDESAVVQKIYTKARQTFSELGVNQRRVTVEIATAKNQSLRLGSDVDISITVDRREDVLRIPEDAIFEKEGKDCVFVVEEGEAVLRQVTIGLEGEEYYEALEGLKEGDMVILSPGEEIKNGTRVKTK